MTAKGEGRMTAEQWQLKAARIIICDETGWWGEKPADYEATISRIAQIIADHVPAYADAQSAGAQREAWEAGRNAAADYMQRVSERWVESLPIDEVQSINCEQASKAIRLLVYPASAAGSAAPAEPEKCFTFCSYHDGIGEHCQCFTKGQACCVCAAAPAEPEQVNRPTDGKTPVGGGAPANFTICSADIGKVPVLIESTAPATKPLEKWVCPYHRSYDGKHVPACIECAAGALALDEARVAAEAERGKEK